MLKSSGGIGAATLASRVLGLVRDQSLAAFMGTHGVAAAFAYAFMVPNLFRRLLGEGALTAAFIPIFKAKEKNEGEASMWQAANAVISGLLVAAPALVLYAMLLISLLLLGGGWDEDTQLMFRLMRLMFPYMMLACLGAIFMGILNARGHFFIPALSPAILNVVLIASVWWLAPHFGRTIQTQVFALAIGVLAAGVAQAVFQMPPMRGEGFRYRWVSPWHDPTTREVVVKMIPSAIGVAAFQINVMLTQTLAFGKSKDIVAEFFYAVRLLELPQGVIGLSLATFLLPTLSALAVEKNYGQFRATLRQGVNYLIFINLLAAVLLFTLAEPIIRLLFERGKFNADSTEHVSFGLVCLAPGLISFSLVNILARAFYALQDIRTPMWISVFCLALNVLLTVFFLFGTDLGAGALGHGQQPEFLLQPGPAALRAAEKIADPRHGGKHRPTAAPGAGRAGGGLGGLGSLPALDRAGGPCQPPAQTGRSLSADDRGQRDLFPAHPVVESPFRPRNRGIYPGAGGGCHSLMRFFGERGRPARRFRPLAESTLLQMQSAGRRLRRPGRSRSPLPNG